MDLALLKVEVIFELVQECIQATALEDELCGQGLSSTTISSCKLAFRDELESLLSDDVLLLVLTQTACELLTFEHRVINLTYREDIHQQYEVKLTIAV